MVIDRRTFLVTAASLPLAGANDAHTAFSSRGGLLTLTFDDGWASQYTNALPILQNAGIKATFYIVSDPALKGWKNYMNAQQILHISNLSHEIGSHTVTHPDLTILSAAEVSAEVHKSKVELESLLGSKKVRSFAYPYAAYNNDIVEAVMRSGYESARAGANLHFRQIVGYNTASADKYRLQAAAPTNKLPLADLRYQFDLAQEAGLWLILVFHHIEISDNIYSNSQAYLEEAVSYIKSRHIRTVTISEGLDAVCGRA